MSNELMNLIESVEIESISTTLNKVATVQATIQKTLKNGHDYDTIPGTQKPTLLKPGAEKILMMFGLTSEYNIVTQIEDWKAGVFAYTVRCILSKNGKKITEGLGSCNSKEDKYRYRWVKKDEVPAGLDLSTLKIKESQYGENYNKYRIENDEIYSQVNTILKMAKKRAQVDATLTVGSLSEIFTQDIEEMKEFTKTEQLDNLSLEDAMKLKVNFGKYKGYFLGDLVNMDPNYVKWLADNAKDEIMKKGALLLLNKTQEQAPRQTENSQQNTDFRPVDNEDIPF